MFAGIGGFRAGLDRAGGFQCVGHCEIDKYADASYRAIHDIREEELYLSLIHILGQRLMASLRDEGGKREVLANGKGSYVVLEGCGDRRQLKQIRRRIQNQMKRCV